MVQLAAKLAKGIAQKIAENKKPVLKPAPTPLKPFQGKGHRLDDDEPVVPKVIKSITKQSKKVKKTSTVRTKGTAVPTLVA